MSGCRQFKNFCSYLAANCCVAVFVILATVLNAQAVTFGHIVINEVMWDGTEYLELLNTSTEPVSLAGWQLIRQAVKGEAKKIITFDEAAVISANGYYLIEKNEESTTVQANAISPSLTLLNTGERVQLLNESGVIIDTANQFGVWFAGKNTDDGVAMERTKPLLSGEESSNWHTSTSTSGGRSGTPGTANSAPKINQAPIAALNGPTTGTIKQGLTFSSEDSIDPDGDNLSWLWDFGNNVTAVGSEVTYTYPAAGTYTVTVAVSDSEFTVKTSQDINILKPSYTDSVVINEVLPDPVGSDTVAEFIELRNLKNTSVDLSGWQLDDIADGGSTPYVIPEATIINGSEYKVFLRSQTKIALNNNGDSVRLLDPNGDLKSMVTYTTVIGEGFSYSRGDSGDFRISTTVTPSQENIFTQITETEEGDLNDEPSEKGQVAGARSSKVELKNVRDAKPDTLIVTEGVISVPPGVFGKQYIYVAGSGIQIYYSKGDWPALKLGDRISITGNLASNQGEARLKISQANNVTFMAHESAPQAHIVSTGDVDETLEGTLVTVQGHVTETSGDTFFIDDGSGEVKIYIKSSTSIEKPVMKKGLAVTITGVVSETSSGYRVLPRFQEDIRLGLVAGLTSFPATGIAEQSAISDATLGHHWPRNFASEFLTLFWLLLTIIIILARRAHEPLLI